MQCLLLSFNLVGHLHKFLICKYQIFDWEEKQVNICIFRAMINELTHKEGERVTLNSYRYAWTVISNIFVYATAAVLLSAHSGGNKNVITPEDMPAFRILIFIVVGVGLVCMIIFHVGIKESDVPAEDTEYRKQLSLSSSGRLRRMTWKSVLREKQFYQCALIWMFTRVILNVTQVRKRLFIPSFSK